MMSILSLPHILPVNVNKSGSDLAVCYSAVDPHRFFIPEQYTQLYHCEAYTLLNDQHKIRYNQLFAARTNEQFMLFESGFTKAVMENLLRADVFKQLDSISDSLVLLLNDEQRHFEMFRSLNQYCFPEFYTDHDYYFLSIPRLQQALLRLFCRYPQHLYALVWLVLLMEEHAVRFSTDLMQQAGSENLDFNFVKVHKAHLRDEARHVQIDANVLDYLLARSSRGNNAINRWLLNKLLRETLKPKQAGLNVIRQLVLEFPELSNISEQLMDGIRSFEYDPCMMPMFADRNLTPVSKALLKLYPEFENALAI
ncbi:MAG TPA: hypothetical protein ENJ32_11570 [Crenotrichaceae bacterium]|nr:hypothetical protein [Crenotrichaceae bacterium]